MLNITKLLEKCKSGIEIPLHTHQDVSYPKTQAKHSNNPENNMYWWRMWCNWNSWALPLGMWNCIAGTSKWLKRSLKQFNVKLPYDPTISCRFIPQSTENRNNAQTNILSSIIHKHLKEKGTPNSSTDEGR